MAEIPPVIDSIEIARGAVRAWWSRPNRMDRVGELAVLIGRCRTEEHLGFLVEALSEVAGRKPVRTVEPPKPPPEKEPEVLVPGHRETPFTKIVKADPKPVQFEEMEADPPSAPPKEPVAQFEELKPAPAGDPPPVEFSELSEPDASSPDSEMRLPDLEVSEPLPLFNPNVAPPPPLTPAPEALPEIDPAKLAPGVDAEILADVMRVEQCRRIFESTHQQIEVWEVFTLVMVEGDHTRIELERLLALRAGGDEEAFSEGALALFQRLLKLRAKFGKFIRDVRGYVATLPVGRFGKDVMEMSLGFLVVSGRGREAALRWMSDPRRYGAEASGRWEALVSTTMRYQTAMQQFKK